MPDIWREKGLVQEFKRLNQSMESRRFCFVLGAGASVTSGIPAGGTLVNRWLERLMERDPQGGRDLKTWATASNLGLEGFELARASEFYPQIFERCFMGDRQAGYQDLEELMKDKDPSVGYSFLAQILSNTRHRVVITTNFDNLVADALAIYSDKHPLICGHESLAAFAQPDINRPLVAKIHRDLFLAPKNDQDGVSALAPGWSQSLKAILARYTPIFVGYGGNDGSLMDFLDALPPGHIRGRSFWCYVERFGKPSPRVQKTLDHLGGIMVPILGFDELMMKLAESLGYGLLDQHIKDVAERRAKIYQSQILRMRETIGAAEAARQNASFGLDHLGKRHTESELDPDRRAAPSPRAKPPKSAPPPPPKVQAPLPKGTKAPKGPSIEDLLGSTLSYAGPRRQPLEDNLGLQGDRPVEAESEEADTALTEDDPIGDAQDALSRMIERTPGWMKVREEAEVAIKSGEFSRAMEIYQEGLETYPDEAYLKVKLGELMETHMDNPERAKGLFRMVGEDDQAKAYELERAALGLERLGARPGVITSVWEKAFKAAPLAPDLYSEIVGRFAHYLMDCKAELAEVEELILGDLQRDNISEQLSDIESIALARLWLLQGERRLAQDLIKGFNHLPGPFRFGYKAQGPTLAFLVYAFPDPSMSQEPLAALKAALGPAKVNFHPRDFSWDAKVAIKAGHPNPALLRTLAEVIARREDVSALDGFVEWRVA